MHQSVLTLKSKLHGGLSDLAEIAGNYWWSWNNQHWHVFEKLNPEHWTQNRNPWTLLNSLTTERISDLARDAKLVQDAAAMAAEFKSYMGARDTWFKTKPESSKVKAIAYFCAEFAIHESLPIYSGGLGVLAGDHVKSASDLGLPEAFVGLFYSEGYFEQMIDGEGHQVDRYRKISPADYPFTEVASVSVPWKYRSIQAKAWRADVGRVPLYLLDFDIPENPEEIRAFSRRLYGGDRTMRLAQEIVLGIGGQRLLEQLSIKPDVYHMNEGHSCLFQIERLAGLLKSGKPVEEAIEQMARSTVFTTHTPVPAGNEAFAMPLLKEHLGPYLEKIGWSTSEFLRLGLVEEKSDWKYFSMTVFALKTSRFANAVSELHGKVARRMWNFLWPNVAVDEVPITSITNGVHVPTWTSAEAKELFTEHLGPAWREEMSSVGFWEKAKAIPDKAFVNQRQRAKRRLIDLVRTRLKAQLERNGEAADSIAEVDQYFGENDLIIGFARRFATYKRATMLLTDVKRLEKIVNQADRPVRFLFAGKAHPMDKPGQAFIEKLFELSRIPKFRGKVIMLEGYDMNISSHMVAGCDVWLNNPRRPFEASGTSGQKVPLNGGINFSVLDGWWREGYNGRNGWAIGRESDFTEETQQDVEDTASFYSVLEEKILPLFFERGPDEHYSAGWLKYLKESLSTLLPQYSTHRMVQDYFTKLYAPCALWAQNSVEKNLMPAHLVQATELSKVWPTLYFTNLSWPQGFEEISTRHQEFLKSPLSHVEWNPQDSFPGKTFKCTGGPLNGSLFIGSLDKDDVQVELVSTHDSGYQVHRCNLDSPNQEGLARFSSAAGFKWDPKSTYRIRVRSSGFVLWY